MHDHFCNTCGRHVCCDNPACTEDDECQGCEKDREAAEQLITDEERERAEMFFEEDR